MHVNILARSFDERDGYGRFAHRLARALKVHGEHPTVMCTYVHQASKLGCWEGITLTISPPFDFLPLPARHHWVFTMTEGTVLPSNWPGLIQAANIERIITPSDYCTKTFGTLGIPTHTIKGGIDPYEFNTRLRKPWTPYHRPYTFLILADRGSRKGWTEVWQAFHALLEEGCNIRLIVKSRTNGNSLIDTISKGDVHPSISFINEDVEDMQWVYRQADCAVIPSRSEGWGMPHREIAAMGIPLITTAYSGLNDFTEEWGLITMFDKLAPIPANFPNTQGEWCIPNVGSIVGRMRWASENREEAYDFGTKASEWMHLNRTWTQTADNLVQLMKETDVWL